MRPAVQRGCGCGAGTGTGTGGGDRFGTTWAGDTGATAGRDGSSDVAGWGDGVCPSRPDRGVSLEHLDSEKDLCLSDAATTYFVCGPETFMAEIQRALMKSGVQEERIRMEVFGTGAILGLPSGEEKEEGLKVSGKL